MRLKVKLSFAASGAGLAPQTLGLPAEAAPPLTFGDVYDRYASYVAAIARRVTGAEADVDDVVQEVFIVCARKLPSIRSMDEARAWLATVAGRVGRKFVRRRRIFRWLNLDDAVDDQIASDALAVDDAAAARGVYRLLSLLPLDLRTVWELRHLDEESIGNIAAICGASEATVKRRLKAAQLRLEEVCREA